MMPNYVKKTAEMDRIADAFSGYIHRHPNLDLMWSEKIGYVLLTVNPKKQKAESGESYRTAESLACRLFSEVMTDVVMETDSAHSAWELDESETKEVRERWTPFLDALPEYAHICEAILSGEADYDED